MVVDERGNNCRVVVDDNDKSIDEKKALIYDNRWYVYMRYNILLIKDGYYVELSGYDMNKVVFEVVEDNVVKDQK